MPICEIASIAAEFDVPMHSDAVQSVGQIPLDFAGSGCSAVSITAHKFGGPVGMVRCCCAATLSVCPCRMVAVKSVTSAPAHRMSQGR